LFFCHILSGQQIKKISVRPKLKVGGCGFLAHIYAYNHRWASII
jgi:hypothetical protein